jgi:hypothetical protein
MSVYSIDSVLTFDVADFKRYSNVNTTQPAAVLARSRPLNGK